MFFFSAKFSHIFCWCKVIIRKDGTEIAINNKGKVKRCEIRLNRTNSGFGRSLDIILHFLNADVYIMWDKNIFKTIISIWFRFTHPVCMTNGVESSKVFQCRQSWFAEQQAFFEDTVCARSQLEILCKLTWKKPDSNSRSHKLKK